MNFQKVIIVTTQSLIFVFLASCSKQAPPTQVFWTQQSGHEAPTVKAENLNVASVMKARSEVVQIEKQTVEGLPLESSFIKKVMDHKQNTLFMAGQYETQFSSKLKKRIQKLKKLSATDLKDKCFKNKNLIKDKVEMGPAELSVRRLNDQLEPVIKFDFVNKDQTLQTWVFNDDFEVIAIEPAGSQFTSIKALAYPEGPKFTPLTTVLLKSIVTESEGLNGDLIKVSTESPNKVLVSDQMQYTPPDEKFDQVQVYYYIQKAVEWFETKKFIEKDKLTVHAMLHVGYPDKTNAAFYYKGLIRLGAGDDQVFGQIAQDPSIVIHETSHGLIERLSQLPYQGEGGSLNEGFADFLTCMMLGNSKLGEVSYKKGPFKRDLTKVVKFSEKNNGLYHDSAIVSSYLWALKDKVNEDRLLLLAESILIRLNPFSTLDEYKTILKEEIPKRLKDDETTAALSLLSTWE